MRKSVVLAMGALAIIFELGLPASAACPGSSLVNTTTADATQVMAWLNCKAPLDSPLFTGNVGIGTPTPSSTLNVNGTVDVGSVFTGLDPAGVGQGIRIGEYGAGGNNTLQFLAVHGSTAWAYRMYGYAGDGSFRVEGNYASAGWNAALTIKSGGNVGIGTASPSYTLHVNGSVAGTSPYNNLSDARLKKNIAPIRDAIAIVSGLRGVRFDWRTISERSIGKSANLPVGSPQIGFIAQELQKVLPEAVSVANDNDHTMSVAESKVVPVLVEAFKDLQARNVRQAAQISQLQKRLTAVEQASVFHTAAK